MTENTEEASLSAKADAAFRQAASKVIQRAKHTGTPVVVWENGRVKEVPADEFEPATGEAKADDSQSDD